MIEPDAYGYDEKPHLAELDGFRFPPLPPEWANNGNGNHGGGVPIRADQPAAGSRAIDGETFITAEPDEVPANWGDGDQVVWAEGEPLMIVGPDGVGKTSVAQQLMLARLELRADLFGFPVKPAAKRVLYIAADRHRQASRSLKRMIHDAGQLTVLRDRLVVWRGPLPFDLCDSPRYLADLAEQLDASDVIIDSLKDVALDLTKDEVGSRVNLAFQETIARGIELAALHHQRKEGRDGSGKPKRLADVYGSRWLTAGMGSVVCLWGDPGDLIVECLHLKQPAEDIGPLKILHDHKHGSSSLYEPQNLEQILAAAPNGITVADVTRRIFDTDGKPKPNEIEKTRRRLESLVGRGIAHRQDSIDGTALYHLRNA